MADEQNVEISEETPAQVEAHSEVEIKEPEQAPTQADLLKSLGLEDVDSLKAQLDELKGLKDSQLSDQEKQQKALEEANGKLSELQAQLTASTERNAALSAGVNADSIDDVLALARIQGGKDIAKNIQAVLDKYPSFSAPKDDGKPKLVTQGATEPSGKQKPSLVDQFKQAFTGGL